MAPKNEGSAKKSTNKGAWTAEEDRTLSQFIETHGPRRWKTIAIKSGLNRCGKSCRLRWLNYLRPNIKRGNISEAEEDLIIRLHKLLGNRWSLIAGRLPGRTDNEIKNYWNSHLSKKINQQTKDLKTVQSSTVQEKITYLVPSNSYENNNNNIHDQQLVDDQLEATTIEGSSVNLELNKDEFDMNDLFDFSVEVSPYGLDWVDNFLELDVDLWLSNDTKR